MMKYLLDSNVLSEGVKSVPDNLVLKKFEKHQHEGEPVLCSLSSDR